MSESWGAAAERQERILTPLAIAFVGILLAGLPLALWLDLRDLSEDILRTQADDLSRAMDSVRTYYAKNVVQRIADAGGQSVTLTNDYFAHPGAVPIPATFALELSQLIGAPGAPIEYRFVSDYPFLGREPHRLDAFETQALRRFRENPEPRIVEVSGSIFARQVRIATPVVMEAACVACHATHPLSPKRDWKVGDVRGIQAITLRQPIQSNIFAFRFLLGYFILAAALGGTFVVMQRRLGALIKGLNRELSEANAFLAGISLKISRYLSPQIYRSIFSGQKDATIATERKKLTIFFSDVVDFTSTTERLQPEDLTELLNAYLTEMSRIALAHGGTVDKFIGDAMLVFFGDPETKGVAEDARACLRMAAEMQRRLAQLDAEWRQRGVETPFRVRMGVNTGFCNVGNFGSADRMDYTIIGAEANLAARLQSVAEPGRIVMSYETYSLVSDIVIARPLEPIRMKGVNRAVVPYLVEELQGDLVKLPDIINERQKGVAVYLDVAALDAAQRDAARHTFARALKALEQEPR